MLEEGDPLCEMTEAVIGRKSDASSNTLCRRVSLWYSLCNAAGVVDANTLTYRTLYQNGRATGRILTRCSTSSYKDLGIITRKTDI